ncbi:MAG: PPC domain-containing protein [Brevundimonas sp.]
MSSIRTRLACASALALVMAVPSVAQESPLLAPGQTVDGVLEAGDARGQVSNWSEEAQFYDDYLLRAAAGQRFDIGVTSDAFDSYVSVYRDGEEAGSEPLASDDDSGGYPHALLRFASDVDGLYRVRVRGFNAEAEGAYQISLTERASAPAEPAPARIDPRGDVQGELTRGVDPELTYDQLYDVYVFRARADERIQIRLNADAFDPMLYVGRGAGLDFEELASNDDSGDTLNSRILFTAPETGDYVIRAAALVSEGEGDYVLSLSDAPEPAPLVSLAPGDEIEGVLDETAAIDDYGSSYVGYVFTARAGQRVAFAMSSADFDTYVELGRQGDGGFEVIAADDDGAGEGLNSRLVHTFEEAGRYELRARSLGGLDLGAYTLEVSEVAPDPEPMPLRFGQTVQGEISDTSAQAAAGGRYDAWRFSGEAGQRVQIIMRSGDFDSYLEIGSADGEFSSLAYDDDGLGEGLNSRLNFTVPASGDYIVRAQPLGGSGRGLYALELTDRGPAPVAGSIMIGATVRGSLTESDSMAAGDASHYDDYRFRVEEGDRLRLTMVSNAFDAFLALGEGLAEDFVLLASDDDSLSDTNALIEHEFDEAGWYTLRANSYAPNSTGAYVITIERQE